MFGKRSGSQTSSSPLPGIATDNPVHSRSTDERASSSPLPGIATSSRSAPDAPSRSRVLIAPTRDRNMTCARRCTWSVVSSSPLPGIATPGAAAAGRAAAIRPHRPYQGSQLVNYGLLEQLNYDRSSSPLPGIATWPARRCPRHGPGPHRPYQGSQHARRRGDYVRAGRSSSPLPGIATTTARRHHRRPHVLIAPTRDRNPLMP